MKNYEININTVALIGEADGTTKVIEKEEILQISKPVNEVMNNSCKYFGSSYEGRMKSSKFLLNADYKLPIIVEESSALIFFPTSSPRNKDCTWINLNHIKSYAKDDLNSKIILKNNEEIKLPISYGSLNSQILRSSHLKEVFFSNKINKNLQ